jgi:hypothetical protein
MFMVLLCVYSLGWGNKSTIVGCLIASMHMKFQITLLMH